MSQVDVDMYQSLQLCNFQTSVFNVSLVCVSFWEGILKNQNNEIKLLFLTLT